MAADDLEIGDICRSAADTEIVLAEKTFDAEPVLVYNFEVEDGHTYSSGVRAKYESQYYSELAAYALADAGLYVAYVAAVETAQREFSEEQCRLSGLLADSIDTGVNNIADGTMSLDVQVCFSAGFEIDLADGTTKKIEEFEGGEEVWARPHDDPNGPLRKCKVVRVFNNGPKETIKVLFDNGLEMQATAEHPFFVSDEGWVSCGKLETGDACVNRDGELVRVLSKELVAEPVPVYNIEVEGAHTYYIGKDAKSLLVHNKCRVDASSTCYHFICNMPVLSGPATGGGPGTGGMELLYAIQDFSAIWSNSRGAGHSIVRSAYIAGGTVLANNAGVSGVTTFYDPTNPVTGESLSVHEQIIETTCGGISLVSTGFGIKAGANRLSKIVKIPGYTRVNPALAPRPGVWNTGDDVLDETVVAIEKAFPGKVYDVNVKVKRPDGSLWTDFDILLDDAVIQVKGKQNAQGIINQVSTSSPDALEHLGASDYRVFGYAPQQNQGWVDIQRFNHSASVTNNLDELLKWIGGQ